VTSSPLPDLDSLLRLLEEHIPAAIELRHDLHAHPQVGGTEYETAARVAAAMDAPDAPSIAEGRVVRIGAMDGPAIGIRAELDALPGTETSGVAWASENGAVHMCGHDVHMAALTAVVTTLRQAGPPVPLVAILQPREELSPGGAVDMLASPVLTDHDLRAMLSVHVQPRLPSGTFSASPGTINASSDEFTITVSGRPGHGAYPHVARDPIVAAAQVVTALQHIVSRSTDPMQPTVITVGSIHGGQAPNAIPETVIMTGTLRAYDADERHRLQDEIRRVATLTADVHGCTADVQISHGEPPLVNDAALSATATDWITRTGLTEAPPLRSCGADDFACYAERYPSLMIFHGVGTGSDDEPGLHHPGFAPDDEHVRSVAASMLAAYLSCCELLLD